MHNVFYTTGVFSKVADCKNLTAEIRLQYDDSFFQKIDEYLGAIEYGKAEKEEWLDEQYMSDSDDKVDEDLERYIQAYDDTIRKMKSELLQRIKTEIVNLAM